MQIMNFLKKYLFHRITYLTVAILVQLFVLFAVTWRFYDYFIYFYGINIIIGLAAVIVIINNRMNPVYKLAWIIPILLFPFFGILFYILFGSKRLRKRYKKRMELVSIETRDFLLPRDRVVNKIKDYNKVAANQSRYIQNHALYPPYYNSSAEYFTSGEEKFASLLEELKNAEEFIFLEYYVINKGLMWDTILDILVQKAKEGVEVRLIYDDWGCLLTLPYKYDQQLEQKGIKTEIFNPLLPILSSKYNNRDHRKIAIIDGHTAFTGGINLADEYINEIEKHGHWKDTAIMFKGEPVWNMTVMFLTMWHHLRGKKEDIEKFKYPAGKTKIDQKEKDGFIQPFSDSPLDDEPVGEIVYLNIINKAEDYLYITTPYLIIDNEIVMALTSAAKTGVDVRIITPHIPDKWYVHMVTRSYYQDLIKSGVRIYEYTPGFIHSKTFVSDDKYGVVGTINMDYRSLYLHFECGVWMYDCSVVEEMKQDFMTTLAKSMEITEKKLAENRGYKSVAGSVLRAFAPLM